MNGNVYTSASHTPVVPVIPGHEPFSLADAYVLSGPISPPHTYLTDAATPPVDTLEGGLSWTGVMEALDNHPQSHAKGRRDDPRVPVWSLVVLFVGLVLTAVAMVGLSYAHLIHAWLSS